MSIVTKVRAGLARTLLKSYDLNSMFLTGREMPWSPGFAGAVNIAAAYENSATAYACIRRKAIDVSSAPLLFLRSPDDLTREVEPNNPIRKLWARPHPIFSREEIIQYLATFLDLRGEAFLAFDDAQRPRQIFAQYDPLWWSFDKGMQGEVVQWLMRHELVSERWLPSEILHHRYIAPGDPYRGQSPLRAAAKAYAISTGGDSLQASIIERGGERGILYRVPEGFSQPQRDQAKAQLRGRRFKPGEIPQDVLLPTGVEVVDPKFIENDYNMLAALPRSDEQICNVYGVPASLLSGKDDNYATFKGRQRIYWSSTLLPMIRGIESAFDHFFGFQHGVFIRFDLTRIEALKENMAERAAVAVQLKGANLPWRQIEAVVGLGVDVDDIPEADDVLVNGMLYPASKIFEEADNPAPPPPPPPAAPMPPAPPEPQPPEEEPADDGKAAGGITNRMIRQRARDPREAITRTRRLAKLERDLKGSWRSLMGEWKGKAIAAAEKGGPVLAAANLQELRHPMGKAMAALVTPFHVAASREGMTSILVISGKADWSDRQAMIEKSVPPLSAAGRDWIAQRVNFIAGRSDIIFDDVIAAVQEAVANGQEISGLVSLIVERFDANAGRAVTIARTEVGTAYNVSRYAEMHEQGFEEHEWLTSEDELVRGNDPKDEFDHTACDGEVRAIGEVFPCGLTYPMADGGDAANVINCRCQTIPRMKEPA